MSKAHTAVQDAGNTDFTSFGSTPATAKRAEPRLPNWEIEAAAAYARAEKSASTRRAYRSDVARFAKWCAERGITALPASAECVAVFLAAEADQRIKPSTLGRRVAAIRYAHSLAGLASPTEDERVRAVLRGIRRAHGLSAAKKSAATADKVMKMAAAEGERLVDLRDRALLLIGFAGAFRRSELVALNVKDFEETPEGLRVKIRRSKTDQEGQGTMIAIPRGTTACPVAALTTWLKAAGICTGAVFRPVAKGGRVLDSRLTDHAVAKIVKARAAGAGFDPEQFSGHSLRSGFLTSAAARGASVFRLADQSRHKSVAVLARYIRDAELFRNHPGADLL